MGMFSLSLLESRIREHRDTIHICIDSRKVRSGSIFVALPAISGSTGERSAGGAAFIQEALARGASFIVCTPEESVHCPEDAVEIVDCPDPHKALGILAQAKYETDHLCFPLVGVTGTNGKTTITWLLSHLFESVGRKTGVLGTVSYSWSGYHQDAPMTTPDCLNLHSMLSEMQKAGVEIAFMEVSSHALDQDRVAGISFAGAIFTNLTRDHLDYHGSMERYFQAKSRLFLDYCEIKPKVKIVGTDNEWGKKLLELVPDAIGFGLKPSGHPMFLRGEIVSNTTAGLSLKMTYGGKTWNLHSPLVGSFNAENLLAVQALGLGFGLEPTDFHCFSSFNGVSGRLERIPNDQHFDIFVDYAHTPDALVNVLVTLQNVGFKRIVAVFGCGGDRDHGKRPKMGEAVAKYADVAVLTSDNPRHEDPEAIIADVLPGLKAAKKVIIEADRRKALNKALEILRPGDALLVAGKGHEKTQQIGDVKHPFSDQQVIREILGCA